MDGARFLGTLAGGLLAAPLAAEAQTVGKVWRIGRLSPSLRETDAPLLDAFRKGMREFGWIDGQTFTVEDRFAEGKSDLVRQHVDVILAGSVPGALAAKNATATIPVVMVATGDPLEVALL